MYGAPVLASSPAWVFLSENNHAAACSTRYSPSTSIQCLLYVQLAVNRQPGYRQGTRRASYCVPVCFFAVFMLFFYENHHFRVTHDELREDTAPRQVMHWTPPLHAARYYRYLLYCQASRRSYRQRRRKSRTSIRQNQKCSGPTGWQSQLRGYYSSSLSSTVLALRIIPRVSFDVPSRSYRGIARNHDANPRLPCICISRLCWPSYLRGYSSPRTTIR